MDLSEADELALRKFATRFFKRVVQPAVQEAMQGLNFTWWADGDWRDPERGSVWIEVSESLAEMVKGADDGAHVYYGFMLDLVAIAHAMSTAERLPVIELTTLAQNRPNVSLEGQFEGRNVVLQIFTEPKHDAEPQLQIDSQTHAMTWLEGNDVEDEDDE